MTLLRPATVDFRPPPRARGALLSVCATLVALGCSESVLSSPASGTGTGGAATGRGGAGGQGAGTAGTFAVAQGGALGSSGTGPAASGGTSAPGGSVNSAGAGFSGGTAGSAAGTSNAAGQTSIAGGNSSGGGSNTATGGSVASAGAPSSGGSKATGGNSSSAGTSAGGGATGGAPGSAGAPSMGGTGGDRCDVGVYDAANAPKALPITNGENVHDPSVIQNGSTYYLFNSGLWTRTSTNLSSWQSISQVLYPYPSWIEPNIPNFPELWAPDVSNFGGRYHLYYSASTFGSKRSCIGHATRASMTAGAWADDGAPVLCSNVDSTVNWNALDPNVIVDEAGTPWLVFGSGWDGIHIVRLTSTGARDPASTLTRIATRTAGVLENSSMVRRCGYYYLFMSWDACCQGADSTYNIRVGRSTSMTGGFVDKAGVALTSGGGTLLVGAGNGWVGPGAPVVLFSGTRSYLIFHAYAASDGHFAVHVSDLYWDASGWPVTSPTP